MCRIGRISTPGWASRTTCLGTVRRRSNGVSADTSRRQAMVLPVRSIRHWRPPTRRRRGHGPIPISQANRRLISLPIAIPRIPLRKSTVDRAPISPSTAPSLSSHMLPAPWTAGVCETTRRSPSPQSNRTQRPPFGRLRVILSLSKDEQL